MFSFALLTTLSAQYLTAPQPQLHSRLIGRIIMDLICSTAGEVGLRDSGSTKSMYTLKKKRSREVCLPAS